MFHVLLCIALLLSSFVIILIGKRELVALLVFMVSCDCYVALPHGAMGWYVVSDCDIS